MKWFVLSAFAAILAGSVAAVAGPSTGTAQVKTLGTDYLAETDGRVVARISARTEGDRGYLNGWVSHDGVTVTEVADASVRFYAEAAYAPVNSLSFPVRRGDYWQVDSANTSGACDVSLSWIPNAQ